MTKVFISQPMGGKSEIEIKQERLQALTEIQKAINKDDIYIIDTLFDFPGKNSLYYLAKSIEALSDADYAYFIRDWENYRGCILEHECCKQYGIPIIYQK